MVDKDYRQQRAYEELSRLMNKRLAEISGELGPDAMLVICQRLIEELQVLSAEATSGSDADWDRKANPSGVDWTEGSR